MFWRRWVLNSGPLVYQPGALTAELLRTDVIIEIKIPTEYILCISMYGMWFEWHSDHLKCKGTLG